MKFYKFQFYKDWKWFVILPTIILTWDALEYMTDNFAISIHWLGWHWRWLWLDKRHILQRRR